MKNSELRSKTSAELNTELEALLQEQFKLRMRKASSEDKRFHNIKLVRRNIARVKTIISEKARESHE